MKARPAILQGGKRPAWLAGLLVIVGVIFYVWQAAGYARTTASSLDEGAYLYKGWLFTSGQYHPFEPNGPQTNKAPLAFLIPGFAESIFGPGLRTGRTLAVVFGALAVILTWWTARRLAGDWLAAGAVWSFALSPVLIKTYSEGVSQSAVAFTLALVLALALGEERPAWQLALSGFLAGALIMIRQNMVVVLPLLVLYIWWQYGAKKSLYAALGGAGVLVFFHVLYWPYIMQLWTAWLPAAVSAWFPQAAYSGPGEAVWNPSIDTAGRLLSIFQGVRFHFAAAAGVVVGLIFWPRRSAFSAPIFRQAVFLAVLFASLLLMHSWAAIGNDYCVFCFTPYLAFFSLTGILLTCLLLRVIPPLAHPFRQALMVLVVLGLCAGIAFSAVEDLGDPLLALTVPRMREGRILPGTTTLGELLANKFAWERVLTERMAAALAGALAGAALLGVVWLLYRLLRRSGWSYGTLLGAVFLGLGVLLSPWMAGRAGRPDCGGMDVIRANEQVGRYLAQYMQAGKMTYWNGGLSVAPLLYVPQARIYLPQINDGYAFVQGGDTQELIKYGLWNDELDSRWLAEADYIIVEGWRYSGMKDKLPASTFDELPRSPAQTSCLEGSGLRFFQRK